MRTLTPYLILPNTCIIASTADIVSTIRKDYMDFRGKRAYLAAAWVDKPRIRPIRDRLVSLGIEITSRWIDTDHVYGYDFEGEAGKDYTDINHSDFLIIDTLSTGTRGGREWEGGYATGRGMPVYRVGSIIIPFHGTVTTGFADWDQAINYFAGQP